MKTHVDIGDIIRNEHEAYSQAYRITPDQAKAFGAIALCRTEKLGTHTLECDHCHHRQTFYNSCRNRNCPKCQRAKQEQWASKLRDQLLPCRYFHIVFTIPCQLNEIIYSNQEVMYNILMQSASKALLQVSTNPKFLGVATGCLSILHTWGQNLLYHPHVHMLVPAGGLSPDGWEWIASGKKFFVPVKVLSKTFRRIFISMFQEAYYAKRIKIKKFQILKQQLYAINWNVYSKKVFGGPGQVISYLGRYTHRVAISNSRVMSYQDGKVSFTWKNYRLDKPKVKVMEIDSLEFVRRFMLHVLPCNFYKIRYSGIFANKLRSRLLEKCRYLLAALNGLELMMTVSTETSIKCPKCNEGKLLPWLSQTKT